ncbi:kinesin-like protein KIN-14E [Gouania willdenowi]|uniref:kinesin-like protein KIN-14E n=1 Tax=Gouania willdenowi TaxID=441366 RepID=UPI001054B825|nr:kinesin-like protein KIN-14E [Gouania willdenowi]
MSVQSESFRMGSAASVSEDVQSEKLVESAALQSSTVAGRSDDEQQADVSESSEKNTEDIQSLKSHDINSQSKDEDRAATTAAPEVVAEGEEVSLDFESFLHNNGMLYSCFNHNGHRVYVDEWQKLQPFPKEWHSQGRFINTSTEASGQLQIPASSQSAVREDDRTGSLYIPGKGTVMTYMFEERLNICRFWEPQAGVWLLLPLQWEMNIEFIKARIERVMSALPGLVDQKEMTAALRQCNYDPEEVISTYLAMFGEILLQAPLGGDQNYSDLNSFRALLERDLVIADLRDKLQKKHKEVDTLLQRNSYLLGEVSSSTDAIHSLNRHLAELEADHQEAQEKIRSLRASTVPPTKVVPKPALDSSRLRQVSGLIRRLNVSNKQLQSTARHALEDMKKQLEQLKLSVEKSGRVQQEQTAELEELRSLYRKEAVQRKSLYNKLQELQGNIRVFCRCRKSSGSNCVEHSDEQELVVVQKGNRKKFQFDKIYPPNSTQEEVFTGTLPVITSCVDGYNVCILAYGQTGSGKTYTMMGPKDDPGVNIRSIRELLRICAEKETVSYTLKVSMLEIYNETLNDLLTKSPGAPLEIRVQGKSMSVPGLTRVQVQTEADIVGTMETGERNRRTASTKMNIQSSRSHLLVALEVDGVDKVSGLTTRGTLTLCDLAGSERLSRTEAEGQRLVEAAAINKSLTALAQVFAALKCNALHIPYRNSKLTLLLQPCLSGDAKCCVFVNVSPEQKDVMETVSTLQFGSSVRQVSLSRAAQNLQPSTSRSNKASK